MKTCSKCKESKDESMFCKNKGDKSGLQSQCKECNKRYRDANRNARSEYAQGWYQLNKDISKKRCQKWYQLHKDEIKECSKKWRSENPEYQNQWREEHPELLKVYNREYHHRRRLKLKDSPFPKEFKLMPHCWVCLSTENLCVDHIIPVTRGGTNDISNLTTLCRSCNSSKGNKTYTEWFEKRFQQARLSRI